MTLAQSRGRQAEDQALAYLQGQGLCLLSRNVRFKVGELDLVMKDQESIVFVEVRWRSRSAYVSAAESVNRSKQARMIKAAHCWLATCGSLPPCRFDVVAIGPAGINWIRAAFSGL